MARARPGSGTSEQTVIAVVRRLGLALQELGLGEIEVAWADVRVRVQRSGVAVSAAPAPAPAAIGQPAVGPVVTEVVPSSMVTVESPMVGTFYRAPSPNADPYVREGDVVKEGQIVCVIEAMKLMNEIESKVGGRVAKVLVENGHAVEYGQALFLIEPTG